MAKTYRLPDSSQTTRLKTYLDEWHAIADFFKATFGWTLMAFDPGYLFDTKSGTLSLTSGQALDIMHTFNERKENHNG